MFCINSSQRLIETMYIVYTLSAIDSFLNFIEYVFYTDKDKEEKINKIAEKLDILSGGNEVAEITDKKH